MNILTFDIEDWFHIEFEDEISKWYSYESRLNKNINHIFELLEKYNKSATFFCLGWIAEKHKDVIKQIDKLGFEIGSHSFDHKLVFKKNKKLFEEDLKKSIYSIEDAIGKKVIYYRAPAFSINEKTLWFFEILNKYGIEIDASVFPGKRDFGGFPSFSPARPVIINYNGISIKEFPINIHNFFGSKIVFSGGGYFRLLPYYFIKRFAQKTEYMMTYFHPRDFDSEQPVLQGLSFARKMKSYIGLKKSLIKFDKFLKDFDFYNLSDAVNKIDWNEVDKIFLKD